VGLIASALAYGNVKQIKRSIARVVEPLGAHPAAAIDRLDAKEAKRAPARFKHRFNDGRDVRLPPPVPEADARAGGIGGRRSS
jgi:hypothetical protein